MRSRFTNTIKENTIDNRANIEGLVLSSLVQDLSLISEFNLNEQDFKYDKSKFFFGLIRDLSKKYKEIDEVTVATHVGNSPTLSESYKENGGWDSFKRLYELGNSKNYDKYVDDLLKVNMIEKLKKKLPGWDETKEIEIDGVKVKPVDKFPLMTSSQVYDFIELLIADVAVDSMGDDIVVENLVYSEEDINLLKEGSNEGTPYSVSMRWINESGEERYTLGCPSLSNITNGCTRRNGVFTIAGTSGLGKSTWMFTSVVLGLVESGEKVLIVSNEMTSEYFKNILLSYVCSNVYNYHSVTRKKISNWDFSSEEEIIVRKAMKFIEDKYSDNIKFIAMNEFSIEKITKIAKKLALSEGFGALCVDTFKSETSSEDVVNNMVQGARDLDIFGKKMNMIVIMTMQIGTYAENKVSYLSAAELSNSKQVKETCNTLLLFRKVANDIELDPSKTKFYLKPYKMVKDTLRNKLIPQEITLDTDKKYVLCFVNKNREGDSDQVLIYSFDGRRGMFVEEGYAGFVSRGQLSY